MGDIFAKHNLPLDLIGSVCSDGAPAMLGNRSVFAVLMQKEITGVKITQCPPQTCSCSYDVASESEGDVGIMYEVVNTIRAVLSITVSSTNRFAKKWEMSALSFCTKRKEVRRKMALSWSSSASCV